MSEIQELNQQASQFYNQGDLLRSVKLSEQVLVLDPENYSARLNLGNICYLQKKYLDALSFYNCARKNMPKHPAAYVNIAMVAFDLKKNKVALKFLQRALKMDSLNQTALVLMGQVLLDNGKEKQSVSYFKKALKQQPRDFWLHAYLGRALQKCGKHKKALDEMWLAVELSCGADSQHLDLAYGLYEIASDKGRKFVDSHLQKWYQKYAGNDIVEQTWNAFYPDENFTVSRPVYISRLFDIFASGFEECLTGLNYNVPRLIGEKVYHFYKADSKQKIQILDAGCGTGFCSEYIKPVLPEAELYGVDLSSEMLRYASEKNAYKQLVNDELVHYLATSGKKWDVIIAADVLTYFGKLENVFSAVVSALGKNGIFVFSASKNTDNFNDWTAHLSGRFLHSEKYLRRLLEKNGFFIVGFEEAILRNEGENKVSGWIISARRN